MNPVRTASSSSDKLFNSVISDATRAGNSETSSDWQPHVAAAMFEAQAHRRRLRHVLELGHARRLGTETAVLGTMEEARRNRRDVDDERRRLLGLGCCCSRLFRESLNPRVVSQDASIAAPRANWGPEVKVVPLLITTSS